ncbi:MAG: hypothetical protein HY394_05515 [Candidatus Diapherotrites archaeon]|nr:hypothetical protein [Candidatus Diapherotrites archaeon]
MDRRQILLDSVKKLVALDVSDEEIILNLKDVGLSQGESERLIREAKGKPVAEEVLEEVKSDSGKVLRDVAERLAMAEPPSAPEPVIMERRAAEEPKIVVQKTVNLNKLWEKGILTTVDQKLGEMERLKKSLDDVIDRKISDASKKGVERLTVLFESKASLLSAKVDAQLEAKSAELTKIIDAKVKELKDINSGIKSNLSELEKKRQEHDDAVKDFDGKIAALENAKKTIMSEATAELIKSKSEMQDFLDNSREKMQEIDERVSRTLELESKIAEGLLKDAEAKIDEMALAKSDELAQRVEKELKSISALKAEVDPGKIRAELDSIREKSDSLASFAGSLRQSNQRAVEKMQKDLFKESEDKLVEIFSMQKQAADKKADNAIARLDSYRARIEKEVDPEKFSEEMKNLDVFKQQFIRVIEENVKKFNESVGRLNAMAQDLDKRGGERIKRIDAKIAELEAFEKNFADEMGIAVEKLAEKEKKKEQAKKKN